ncbi:recombinase family protein [Salarchaeum sp. III]|uniref:recombinase family protein n=1 Tax=Salarchaeum sp. III TaxID=3107927 RepID=UPI002ED85856
MAKIGYARVSTQDQNLDTQVEMLKKEGCEKVFQEKASGSKGDREEFQKCLDYLRPGDTLVVYKLDRLGRTTKQLVDLATHLKEHDIDLHSIKDNLNTETAQGRFFFYIMSAFAEMEGELIRERTRAGLESARARGRKGGRPPTDPKQIEKALKLYDAKSHKIDEINEITGVSKSKLYEALRERKSENE